MATTVISKSSINVVGGGEFTSSSPGTGGIGLSTSSSQYAIMTASAVTAGDAIIIGGATFALGTANTPYTFYVRPSTSVARTQSATAFNVTWTIFANT